MNINQKIFWLRSLRKWSQKELSEKSGIREETISRIEQGRLPELPTLVAFRKAFGIASVRELLKDVEL
jgi:transcriptional regulator with XRE-family HTH domain